MTTATLRSLYSRTTRAFVHRDIGLTYSLLHSAFSVLHPPALYPDPLAECRRKWDILRITFETVVYLSPPAPQKALPDELRKMLLESPPAFLKSMYTRSLVLFTPTDGPTQKGAVNVAYLPVQVLLTLVYSSVKVNSHDSGRYIIEEWLARRDPLLPVDSAAVPEGDGYERVLELYCLHILPNLEQWDYAREFLEYETELPDAVREKFKSNLCALHTQALDARKTPQPRQITPSMRPASPTPSTSSSSSLSTTSTHTVKPSNARGRHELSSLPSLSTLPSASVSTSSVSSDTTATPHGYSPSRKSHYTNGHGHGQGNRPHDPDHHAKSSDRSSSRQSSSSSSRWSSFPFISHSQTTTLDPSNPSTFALIKATLASYFTLPKLSTLLIIFVLFPVISFLLRFRHKRRKVLAGGSGGAALTNPASGGVATPLRNGRNGITNAELVRRRLQQIGTGGDASIMWKLLAEIMRVVMDTVKMAGSGLV
ncbi:hypothetical protein AX15_002427 [Amanita polypyramis BW_CC]|nr:hypothetical protein AX15_002427 [Amanita polypyramis BW_CC]